MLMIFYKIKHKKLLKNICFMQEKYIVACDYLERIFILKTYRLNFAAFRPLPALRIFMVLLVAFDMLWSIVEGF